MSSLTEREFLAPVHQELKSFQQIKPMVFYTDVTLTGITLWTSLYLMSIVQNMYLMIPLAIALYLSMFRAGALIHEVVHFKNKVKGLESLYNIMIGFPMRTPVYIHTPHQFHHNPTTFGTESDPEYLCMEGMGLKYFFRPFLAGFLIPVLLLLRFGIYPLFSILVSEKVRTYVFQKLSTIVVNPGYIRPLKLKKDLKVAFWQDLCASAYVVVLFTLWQLGVLNNKFFILAYIFMVLTAIVNIFRARVAHRYDNHADSAMSPLEALRDSVTVTGNIFTPFWAPIGLQYHSLHHLSPQIPYYNLSQAHKHLMKVIDENHPYAKTVLPSFTSGVMQFKDVLTSQS